MTISIDMETLLTTIYVEVDDWYQVNGTEWRNHKPGVRPEFRDSEVITLLLAQEYLPYPGETQFLGHIRANYGDMFPQLPDQSQFNRRAKHLRELLERLRRYWVQQLMEDNLNVLIVDTKPIPVVGYKRSKRQSDFAGSASYGYCSSRNMHYFGYKLVMLTTLDGLPLVYDLVPAHTEERQAAETVLQQVRNMHILGDKGFIGDEWQRTLFTQTGNRMWTFLRRNQATQNPPIIKTLLARFRRRIETSFNLIQNTGRCLERLLARSVIGLCTRVAAKMAAFCLTRILKQFYHIDICTFQAI